MESIMLAERLKKRMNEVGMSAREIAERSEVGRSFIYDILSGKSANPTTIKLTAVAETLGVTVPFLISGEEEEEEQRSGMQHFTAIPFITVSVGPDGKAIIIEDSREGVHYFRSTWLKKRFNTKASGLGMLYVRGDNMQPTLYNNDMILLDLTQRSPSPPGVLALFDGIGIVLKRIALVAGVQPVTVRVKSDNSQYGFYEQRLDEVDIIGRVLWYSREL